MGGLLLDIDDFDTDWFFGIYAPVVPLYCFVSVTGNPIYCCSGVKDKATGNGALIDPSETHQHELVIGKQVVTYGELRVGFILSSNRVPSCYAQAIFRKEQKCNPYNEVFHCHLP